MDSGSSSETLENGTRQKGIKKNQDSLSPKLDPFVPRKDHNPRELRSWAKRTGFVSNFSGDVLSTVNERERESVQSGRDDTTEFDLESGEIDSEEKTSPKIEIDPIFGRARTNNRGIEIEPASRSRPVRSILEDDGESSLREVTGRNENERSFGAEPVFGVKENERKVQSNANVNGNGNLREEAGVSPVLSPRMEQKKDEGIEKREREVDIYPGGGGEPGPGGWRISPRMKCGIRENPGYVPLIYYGIQHYLSLAGSLIFIPVIVVPAMGGSDKDTATVISTMLLVSGITTILHSYFGTRLPLVQGSSFVFLAPALVILNSREYRNLSENKFRHIMRELQGAIIVGSIFQCLLGFSGFMSLLLRFVNPVVVSPTVAAIGLAFFSFGFPQAGSCVEISIPLILLVLIFTLYLRGVSIFGLRVFRIYAVPLSVILIWAYAFFLTAGGAYNYKGCSSAVPASNILVDSCRRHAYTMKHCRTDVSNAWKAAAWVGVPYPFQWGIPIFHFRTSLIMVIASLVASVDSIGTYHSSALRVHSKPPAPGIVSRGIGMEGFCSLLAGLWGTGTGSTTLTENVHTINVTKVASRRAVQLGAILLIFFSFIGKVGAIVASIPQALAASVLCFMWALVVALGLSTLQYSQTASFRNITIVGVSLFLGLSIPAYVQQYQPETSLILPSYFVPYAAASDGPVNTGSKDLDFALNGLLSMNMVVTLLVAFVLDNTVPGSRQERGVYIWSSAEDLTTNPSIHADYSLPARVTHCFRWASFLVVVMTNSHQLSAHW